MNCGENVRGVKTLNTEVIQAEGPIVKVSRSGIEYLKSCAVENERRRIRLCTHNDTADLLHEMLIVHEKGTYVRPHKHMSKIESIHIIEGLVDLVIFDDNGTILDVVSMGDYASSLQFYCRMSYPYYHTLVIRSDVLIFHEVTNGPFKRDGTIFAPWAPPESDLGAINIFMTDVVNAMSAISNR